ncbi:MAG: ribosome biogenesis GTP-binding protein YihA/YsxC [Pseudomonadota bacterium]
MTKKVPPIERLDATFLTSAPDLQRCPRDNVPEVAFAGRSNAGKSSVLNRITDNRKMAKVSKTPGRTQLLNFFSLRTGGRLVDLPGYGYAKAGKGAQAKWQSAVNQYLSKRDNLVGLVLVMDIRHPNQPYDQELLGWADSSALPTLALLNKCDKLGSNQQQQSLQKLRRAYQDHKHLHVQTFSALKGTGKADLIQQILRWLALDPAELDPAGVSAPHPS